MRAVAMPREDGRPSLCNQDGPAPAICKPRFLEDGVQGADAGLETSDESRRFASFDILLVQLAPILHMDQPSAEYRAPVGQGPSPQIRKIDGVKRSPGSEAEALESALAERLGGDRKREFGLSQCGQAAQL